jgi:hypothetical protein
MPSCDSCPFPVQCSRGAKIPFFVDQSKWVASMVALYLPRNLARRSLLHCIPARYRQNEVRQHAAARAARARRRVLARRRRRLPAAAQARRPVGPGGGPSGGPGPAAEPPGGVGVGWPEAYNIHKSSSSAASIMQCF